MSRTTVTSPKSLPIESMVEFEAKSKMEAVVKAIRDEIRLKNIGKIKAIAGKIEFLKSADELRHEDERLRIHSCKFVLQSINFLFFMLVF